MIIRTKPGAQASIKAALRSIGNTIRADHQELQAFTADVRATDLQAIADDPSVESVSLDAPVRAHANNNYDVLQDTLGILGATSYTGSGVVVALIDSGIQRSSDFSTRIKDFYDFTKGGVATSAYDDYGHGTHVAGLIGSKGNMSSWYQYQGVASGVKFVGLKVLDANGQGYSSQVIQAIDFAVTNKAVLGIDIINLSLGHPIYESATTDPLVLAVERAVAAGIVVVTSAGNYGINPATGLPGYAGITSPGNAKSAITVGAERTFDTAIRSDDAVAEYSSRGPTWYDAYAKPDLVAPGQRVISNAAVDSTIYNLYPNLRVAGTNNAYPYMKLSGTSMAAGVATGVVALVMEANRAANSGTTARLTPNAIKAILQFTTIPLRDANGVAYDVLTQGAGGLNALGAIQLASAIKLSARTGSNWLRTAVSPWTTIGGERTCGRRTSSGAPISSGGRISSGAPTSSGAPISCGGRTLSGAPTSCGVLPRPPPAPLTMA